MRPRPSHEEISNGIPPWFSRVRLRRTVFDVAAAAAAAAVPVAEVKLASERTELGQTLKCGKGIRERSSADNQTFPRPSPRKTRVIEASKYVCRLMEKLKFQIPLHYVTQYTTIPRLQGAKGETISLAGSEVILYKGVVEPLHLKSSDT